MVKSIFHTVEEDLSGLPLRAGAALQSLPEHGNGPAASPTRCAGSEGTLFQCGRIDERLEHRARLADGLRGAVELAAAEVVAAHHRADRPVVQFHSIPLYSG